MQMIDPSLAIRLLLDLFYSGIYINSAFAHRAGRLFLVLHRAYLFKLRQHRILRQFLKLLLMAFVQHNVKSLGLFLQAEIALCYVFGL